MIRALALVTLLTACTANDGRTKLWVYTSSYKDVLALYDEALAREMPDLNVQWFQGGSETIASKVTAEVVGGGPRGDLIMTADLFFYLALNREKAFLPLAGLPGLERVPDNCLDADRQFIVNRFPIMVLTWNPTALAEKNLPMPKSLADLTDPRYRGLITMPSPLESGTAMTTMLYWKSIFGAESFKKLRANDLLAAGGNGAALARIDSGERPLGLVLLENVMAARKRGATNIEYAFPSEGGLAMPAAVAIFRQTKHPEAARRLMSWLLGPTAQKILVDGFVYSPLKDAPSPVGTPAWAALPLRTWSLPLFAEWGHDKSATKDLFRREVMR